LRRCERERGEKANVPFHFSFYEPYMDNFRIGRSREGFISDIDWIHDPDEIKL
jgi:hypothetical protein